MSQTIPLDSGSQPTTAITKTALSEETQAAALVIGRFRAALDWMIAHPDWEGAIALSINDLGYKGQRQGISFRQAALSLSLEEKAEAIRHMLKSDNIERLKQADARTLAKLWKLTGFKSNGGRVRLSSVAWKNLRNRLSLRISNHYSGYKKAQRLLFVSYSTLPKQIARACCKNRSHRDDAEQEGRLALLQAIDKIQIDQTFEAYARQWIKRRIQNFVMRERIPVKAPINLISESFRHVSESVPKETSRSKTLILNCLRDGIVRLDCEHTNKAELGEALNESKEYEPGNLALERDDKELIGRAMQELTSKQREVLELRFGLEGESGPQSLAEIAAVTGISRQQVFQREKRAIAKLKSSLQDVFEERFALV